MTETIRDDGLRGFLSYLSAERNASAHTCSSYALDIRQGIILLFGAVALGDAHAHGFL